MALVGVTMELLCSFCHWGQVLALSGICSSQVVLAGAQGYIAARSPVRVLAHGRVPQLISVPGTASLVLLWGRMPRAVTCPSIPGQHS